MVRPRFDSWMFPGLLIPKSRKVKPDCFVCGCLVVLYARSMMVGSRTWGSWGNRDALQSGHLARHTTRAHPCSGSGCFAHWHASPRCIQPAPSLPSCTAAGHGRPKRQSSPTPFASPSPSVHLQQIDGRKARLDAQISAQKFDHEAQLEKGIIEIDKSGGAIGPPRRRPASYLSPIGDMRPSDAH